MEWACIWDKAHCHEDVKLIWGIISGTDSWDTEKTSRGENRNGREDEDSIKLVQHGVRQVVSDLQTWCLLPESKLHQLAK